MFYYDLYSTPSIIEGVEKQEQICTFGENLIQSSILVKGA
jgi:hypothetical protein